MFLKLFAQIKRNWNLLSYLLLAIFSITIFAVFQWSIFFPDPDTFYHMKVSQLLLKQGLIKDFPWLYYTVLNDYYIDHHLLYHIFLIPFVSIGNALIGIKAAVVVGASSFILLFSVLAKKLKMKGGVALALLLTLTIPFTFRLNLVKANALSLIILFIGIYLAHKYKFKLLFILSFLYVWAYGGFILLIGVVGLMAIIDVVKNKKIKRNLTLIFSNILGIAGGIVINPYFPDNLSFYWQQVVQIGIINYQDKIGVGGEWYPYGLVELLTGCSILNVLVFISLILFIIFIKKQNKLSWFSLILFLVGLGLVLKSRRYIEYYVPFSALFVLISMNVSLKRVLTRKWYEYIAIFWRKNWINKIVLFIFSIYIALIVPAIVIKDFKVNYRDLQGGISYYKFENAGKWLEQNAEPDTIVFHSDWDEFPMLFYHSSNNYYIIGLDPTFMFNYDEDLYWKFVNITIGKQKEDLYTIIKYEFDARYVLLEKDHTKMDNNLQKFSEFELVYEDKEAKIYRVE